jgi:integrase
MLYKRGNVWWVHIARRGKKPIRVSAGTEDRQKAQEYHDKLANESWRKEKLGERRRVWEAAVVDYLIHTRKRSLGDDREMLAWLDPHLRGETLETIAGLGEHGMSKKWDEVLAAKREDFFKQTGRQISDARLNRYRSVVGKILRDNGVSAAMLRKYREPKQPKRFLTYELAMETLPKAPEWARDPLLFDWAVGLRKGNLLGLKWPWVDLQSKVIRPNPEEFKQGTSPEIPLNSKAIEILRRQLGKRRLPGYEEYVFVRDGKPIGDGAWRVMWDKIRPTVLGKPITFHSAGRKTWASWLRQEGAQCEDIREAGGWKTLSIVVDTYAGITPHHLQSNVELLADRLHKLDTEQRSDPVQVGAGKGI